MTLSEMQGYAYFFFTVFLVVILYGYILHLYRSEKKGERDYEKYGKMALDDELHDRPVEVNPKAMNEKKES
ncbi:cytochrome c oxidase, cbb3-type, CcoQ subunit [Nitratifractor sp.]